MLNEKRTAMIEMLICAVLWSIGGILIKLVKWNPFAIAGVRSLFSALTVLIYTKIGKMPLRLTKQVAVSSVLMALAFIAFVSANKLTTAANAIVIQYTLPLFIMIFSVLFFKEKFVKKDVFAVVFTFGGILLFFFDQLDMGKIWGNIIAIFSGMFLAGMYIGMGRAPAEDKISITFFGHLFTAIIGIPFLFVPGNEITAMSVFYIIILGVFQLGIPYILFAHASRTCPPLACSLLSAIEPILNPLWVLIFDGEKPGVFALVGGVIVILTVTLWCLPGKKEKKA